MKSGMSTIRGPNQLGLIFVHDQVIGLMPPDPCLNGDTGRLRIAEVGPAVSHIHRGRRQQKLHRVHHQQKGYAQNEYDSNLTHFEACLT